MLDLIVEDKSGISAIFFLISEANVKRMLTLPYVSICSDAGSIADEEPLTLILPTRAPMAALRDFWVSTYGKKN